MALRLTHLLALALALLAAPLAQAQNWKPSKPVTIIVPWPAGGSTDELTRLTAAELEKHLGQKLVVVNQPGASGAAGTRKALEAPRDGYTWTAGAVQDLTSITDWHLFLSVANLPLDEGRARPDGKANYFGMFVPKGVPPHVVATVDRIWGDHIMRADTLRKYAASRGALFAPMTGQDAQKAAAAK